MIINFVINLREMSILGKLTYNIENTNQGICSIEIMIPAIFKLIRLPKNTIPRIIPVSIPKVT